MRNYIILNNKNSNTISGLIIQELAPISKPLQRTQVETIDGRDGDIVTPLGYAAYNKKIKIGLYGDFDINEIIAYFATQGTAIFSNEPDKYYNYQILDQIDYERLVRFRVATVTMHVQPFKYSATEGTLTIDASDTVSGEGSEIALDNTAEAPFTTLRHKGNAIQNGTPTPDAPIDISVLTGDSKVRIYSSDQKNIADPQDFIDWVDLANSLCEKYNWGNVSNRPKYGAWRGRDHVVSWNAATLYDKRDQMTNPTYDEYRTLITNNGQFKENTQYTISGDFEQSYAGASVAFNLGVRYTDNSFGYITIKTANAWVSSKFTTAAGKTIKSIQALVSGGTSYIDLDTLQIEEGTQASDYTPHIKQEYKLALASKNLCYGTSIPVSTQICFNFYKQDIKAGTYTLSTVLNENVTNNTVSLVIDGTATTLGTFAGTAGQTVKTTFTLTDAQIQSIKSASSAFIRLYKSGASFTTPAWAQLELGSSATEYQEYFTPIELAAIGDYADEPVKVGDTWYIRRAVGKVVLDGSEAGWFWTAAQTRIATLKTNIGDMVQPATGDTTILALNTHFTPATEGQFFANDATGVMCITAAGYFNLRNTAWTDLASAKSWLASNTPTLYYALAEPTDEEITNQDLIDALDEFYGQAHSYKGRTHITAKAQGDSAPAVLSVAVNEDNESTVTNAGNTTSRPILTIYGQGDIGVYINDVEVLDIALGNEQYITLDSTEMDAYKDSPANLKNRLVTGDYSKLALNAGANKIYFTGNVTKYEISKYSRWL